MRRGLVSRHICRSSSFRRLLIVERHYGIFQVRFAKAEPRFGRGNAFLSLS